MRTLITPDTKALWKLYTTKLHITRGDIMKAFGCSSSTAGRYYDKAEREQRHLPQFSNHTIRTKEAFKTWGINIDELKERIKEITK